MDFYLKTPVYFKITVPNGTDRKQVSNLFRELLEKDFRSLIKKIRLSDSDLKPFRDLYGNSVNIRLMTEMETLADSASGSKFPSLIEY